MTCPTCGRAAAAEPLTFGLLTLGLDARVRWSGFEVALTQNERLMLAAVMRAAPNTVSRPGILAEIGSHAAEAKVIDVNACRIRRAFARMDAPNPLRTVWGEGYALSDAVLK